MTRKTFRDHARRADAPTRRRFLAGAAQGAFGIGLLPSLSKLPGVPASSLVRAHRCIYIYLSGGMSHIDTLDPKPGREVMGPMETIGTRADGIQLGQHLPLLAQQMDKATLIRSMWSNQGAHVQGRYFMHTSYEMRGTIRHPSLGAWLGETRGPANPTLPGHVQIGGDAYTAQAGYLPSKHAPLPIGDPTAGLQDARRAKGVDRTTFDRRLERLRKMNEAFLDDCDTRDARAYDEAYTQAVELMGSRDLAAFDLGAEDDAVRDAYGRERIGQACLLARRLAEHDVRFIEVVHGGWDTHNQNFDALEERLPNLDRALAALLTDLDARGLLDDTLVVLTTEFGRTPRINDQREGRDHHPKAFSSLLAGGGIKRGFVHGQTDADGEEIVAGRVTVPDFNATIAQALGMPVTKEFHSPSGRPFHIAHEGRPVQAVFA